MDNLDQKLAAILNLLTCPICKGTGIQDQYGYWIIGEPGFYVLHELTDDPEHLPPRATKGVQSVECSCRTNARKLLENPL